MDVLKALIVAISILTLCVVPSLASRYVNPDPGINITIPVTQYVTSISQNITLNITNNITTTIYNGSTTNFTTINNITNNITQNFTTIFNITQNFTIVNNITNNVTQDFNITYNITNNITQNFTTVFNTTNNITNIFNSTFNWTRGEGFNDTGTIVQAGETANINLTYIYNFLKSFFNPIINGIMLSPNNVSGDFSLWNGFFNVDWSNITSKPTIPAATTTLPMANITGYNGVPSLPTSNITGLDSYHTTSLPMSNITGYLGVQNLPIGNVTNLWSYLANLTGNISAVNSSLNNYHTTTLPWANITGFPGITLPTANVTGLDSYHTTTLPWPNITGFVGVTLPWANITGSPAIISGVTLPWGNITGFPGITLPTANITGLDSYHTTTLPWVNITGFVGVTLPWANITGFPGITLPTANVTGLDSYHTTTLPMANITGYGGAANIPEANVTGLTTDLSQRLTDAQSNSIYANFSQGMNKTLDINISAFDDRYAHGLLTYYFYNDTSDISGYRNMSTTAPTQTGTENATLNSSVADGDLLQSWATTNGSVVPRFIQSGAGLVHIHALKGGGHTVQLYAKVYQRNSTGTENLLVTSELSSVLTTTETEYDLHLLFGSSTLNSTDRLVAKIFANVTGVGAPPTVTMFTQSDTESRLDLPTSASVIVVPSATTSLPANNITTGTFGIGDYTFLGNITLGGTGYFMGNSWQTPVQNVTDAAVMINNSKYIYLMNSAGFMRKLIGADQNGGIQIGQTGTAIITSINLTAGNAGYIAMIPGGGEAMRITSTGKVGINTSSPGYQFQVSTDGTPAMFESTSLNPTETLVVQGQPASNPRLIVQNSTGTDYVMIGDTGATNDGGIQLYDSTGTLKSTIRAGGNSYIQGGSVGINTTNPVAMLDVNGNININGTPASGTNAIQRQYVESRGQNLVTNGFGTFLNNYNFPQFNFSQSDTYAGYGSFTSLARQTGYSLEYIPVDPTKNYRFSVWAKSGNTDGTLYNASNIQYAGIIAYDADGLSITPFQYFKFTGSTDTTLAATLNTSDTNFTLTSCTGWSNTTLTNYSNNFIWYNYTNSFGYTYPNYTYTRSGSYNYNNSGATGAWDGNTVNYTTCVFTLLRPWYGPTLDNGTSVRDTTSGGTYKYITISAKAVPNTWTYYEGNIGGWDTGGTGATNLFPYGTAKIQLLFLQNYQPTTNNIIKYSNVWFSEMSAYNIEQASTTTPGVINLTAQTFTGTKTFASLIATNLSGSGANVTNVNAILLGGQLSSFYLNITNSSINAATLGGNVASYYLNITNNTINANTMSSQISSFYLNITNSSINANTLSSQVSSYYLNITNTSLTAATTLGGQVASFFLNISNSTINAKTLGGQVSSFYINMTNTSINAKTLGGQVSSFFINISNSSINAATLGGIISSFYLNVSGRTVPFTNVTGFPGVTLPAANITGGTFGNTNDYGFQEGISVSDNIRINTTFYLNGTAGKMGINTTSPYSQFVINTGTHSNNTMQVFNQTGGMNVADYMNIMFSSSPTNSTVMIGAFQYAVNNTGLRIMTSSPNTTVSTTNGIADSGLIIATTDDTDFSMNNDTWYAQQFKATNADYATGVRAMVRATNGAPTTGITVWLEADSAGAPSGTILAQGTITQAQVATGVYNYINFTTPYKLTTGSLYWTIYLNGDTGVNYNYVRGASAQPYANGTMGYSQNHGGTWNAFAFDTNMNVTLNSSILSTTTTFGSSTNLTLAMDIYGNGSVWVYGDFSANTLIDRTPWLPDGMSATNVLMQVRGQSGKLIHSSNSILEKEGGRDVSLTVSTLTQGFQEQEALISSQQSQIIVQQSQIAALQTELCKKDNTYSWCVVAKQMLNGTG